MKFVIYLKLCGVYKAQLIKICHSVSVTMDAFRSKRREYMRQRRAKETTNQMEARKEKDRLAKRVKKSHGSAADAATVTNTSANVEEVVSSQRKVDSLCSSPVKLHSDIESVIQHAHQSHAHRKAVSSRLTRIRYMNIDDIGEFVCGEMTDLDSRNQLNSFIHQYRAAVSDIKYFTWRTLICLGNEFRIAETMLSDAIKNQSICMLEMRQICHQFIIQNASNTNLD
jgi:hypothetical protein